MDLAIVIDQDPLGRNQLRLVLEELGLRCRAVKHVVEARAEEDLERLRLIAIDATQPGSSALNLARRLREKRWQGVLVFLAESLRDETLEELHEELRVSAVFFRPLRVDEVTLRLSKLLGQARPSQRTPSAGLPEGWHGGLRRAHREFAGSLHTRLDQVIEAFDEARRSREPQRITEAAERASALAKEAHEYGFEVASETLNATADLLTGVGASDELVLDRTWRRGSALLDTAITSLPEGISGIATVDESSMGDADTRILLVHEDLATLRHAAAWSSRVQVGLITARHTKEAARVTAGRHIDAALIPLDLPEQGAARLATWLHRQPGLADLPIAFLVDPEKRSPSGAEAARSHGEAYEIPLPLDERGFRLALGRLTRHRVRRKPRVLIVSGDETFVTDTKDLLEDNRIEVLTLRSGASIVEHVQDGDPDLVLMDVLAPIVSGFEATRRLRAASEHAAIPVILVSTMSGDAVRDASFRAGADDLIARPVPDGELLTRIVSRLHRFRRLRGTDPLTGLRTRRSFLAALAWELEDARAADQELSLGLLDIDYLDDVNRHHGYTAGDEVLRVAGHSLDTVLAGKALLGRWADGCFAVALRHESASACTMWLSRAAALLRDHPFEGRRGRFQVSAQMGVSTTRGQRVMAEELMAQAETSLRAVKRQRG